MGRLEQQLKVAREKAAQARQIAEKEREKKVRKLGFEYVNKGAAAFSSQQYSDAVKSLQSYIHLMEQFKGVKENGLTPNLFDPKKEMMDILLVAGVYWDLAKIYDHARGSRMREMLRTCLGKYVMFAKGMPFQQMCGESLRKYIDNDKPKNAGDFKTAYTALTGEKRCFVAGALMDVCDPLTLPRLRVFRDGYLKRRAWGRAFVTWYYRKGPGLARVTDRLPRPARRAMGIALDSFARGVQRFLHKDISGR